MFEEWIKINELYEVSNTGKVRNVISRKVLKGSTVQISHAPPQRETVGRLVWQAFNGQITEGAQVRRFDKRLGFGIDNLYLAESRYKPPATGYNWNTDKIIALHKEGLSDYEIAKQLNVDPSGVFKNLQRHGFK